MKKITLHDGRIANFPDNTPPHIIGKAVARLMMPDNGKADYEAEEKKKKDEQAKRDQLDETRHKEKLAVGLQGVKASQERNKTSTDHVKATAGIAKSLGENAELIASELTAMRKSIDVMGKEFKGLASAIEQSTKIIVETLRKPKVLVKSERGNLIGIRTDDK